MKVCYCLTRADTVGGVQVHVRDLSSHLKGLGHEVLVITGPEGPYTRMLESRGIPFVSCPDLKNRPHPAQEYRAFSFIRDVLRKFEPDVVSMHQAKAGVIGRIVCHSMGLPCVSTAHGWSFTEGVPEPSRTIYQKIETFTAPYADKIICVSHHDRQIGIKAGIESRRLVTVHNGMPDVSPDLRADPGASDPVRIVMLARFDAQKDHRTLLQAFSRLGNGVELELAGDGPLTEEIQGLAKELGIADRVHFLGRRDDIPEILARAQIFALITNWEGFPRTTLEAMRAGLPVVVSDVGGSAESIDEGITGYTVPRGNVNAVYERLAHLVKNPELRVNMGRAARERYEKEFTFQRMFDETFALYRQVIDRHGGH